MKSATATAILALSRGQWQIRRQFRRYRQSSRKKRRLRLSRKLSPFTPTRLLTSKLLLCRSPSQKSRQSSSKTISSDLKPTRFLSVLLRRSLKYCAPRSTPLVIHCQKPIRNCRVTHHLYANQKHASSRFQFRRQYGAWARSH